jgi:wyosine [tRNA(Phe)-imidazoG37] synthetase (radical SAM superfamily)
MLMDGINDGDSQLRELAQAIGSIGPDEVHLMLPTRPPAKSRIEPAGKESIERARAILGEKSPVVLPDASRGGFSGFSDADRLETVAALLARHPLSEEELARTLVEWGIADPFSAIRSLVELGRVAKVERFGICYYRG